jgi:hypothetical protein
MLWCQMVASVVHHAAGEAVQVGAVLEASDGDFGPWLEDVAQYSILGWRKGTLLVADTTWQPCHAA